MLKKEKDTPPKEIFYRIEERHRRLQSTGHKTWWVSVSELILTLNVGPLNIEMLFKCTCIYFKRPAAGLY